MYKQQKIQSCGLHVTDNNTSANFAELSLSSSLTLQAHMLHDSSEDVPLRYKF